VRAAYSYRAVSTAVTSLKFVTGDDQTYPRKMIYGTRRSGVGMGAAMRVTGMGPQEQRGNIRKSKRSPPTHGRGRSR
jgi:hypothetical protein